MEIKAKSPRQWLRLVLALQEEGDDGEKAREALVKIIEEADEFLI